VRLQIVPSAEGVVDQIVVVGEPDTLRFGLDHRRGLHVKVTKVPKDGKTRIVVRNKASLILRPQIKAHAHT
jgi:hypothetical protein